jgi:DNA polymerase I-like protein with 3'-5' exonuclease and polymerase domains
MANVAIVEKYKSNFNYGSLFPFDFDQYALVDGKREKVLKKDIQLDIPQLKETYKYIILVGKESCKFIADIRSVVDFQGFLVEDKYIALLNPIAVKLNPSRKSAFEKAINDIISVIVEEKDQIKKVKVEGIETTDRAKEYLTLIIGSSNITAVAMDTETSSLYPREGELLGISIAYNEDEGVYISADCITDEIIELLQVIANKYKILFFNAKFDKKFLSYHLGLVFPNFEDVMLEHYTLDENDSHGLKQLAIKYTNYGDYDKELELFKIEYCSKNRIKQEDFTYNLIPFNIIYPYAAIDAVATFALHAKFYTSIAKNSKLYNLYEDLLKPASDALQEIENNGIPISKPRKVKRYINYVEGKINKLVSQLYEFEEIKKVEEIKGAVFNPNSTYHVSCLFHDVLGLPVKKLTDSGKPSVDAEVLEILASEHPAADIINKIKKLKKINATYLIKILNGINRDGRLRTFFNLHTTTSGRLSSSGKINAQQLPRKDKYFPASYLPKKIIEARPGFKIVSQDLKTAEMYIAAVLSGDRNLQKVFITGVDYHGYMAIMKFGLNCSANEVGNKYPDLRQEAKTISFEILYKLNYNEPALENFPTLKKWLKEQETFIKKNGFIYSFFGRKRRLGDVFSPDKKEAQHHVRSGINFLVQSVASDINLLATIEMLKWIKENGYSKKMIIFGLVHDSILAEVSEDVLDIYTAKLKEFTQKDRGLTIPNCPIGIDLEIGRNYAFT